jgi:hypothetical protein
MRIQSIAFATISSLSSCLACAGASPNPGGNGGGAGMVATGGVANPGGASSHSGGGTAMGAGGTTGGIGCGTKVCGTGQYCCNASCSMCAPMGAACIQIACTGGGTQCTSDTDCRLFDNYCSTSPCSCDAVLKAAPDPTCGGATVTCFAAPCMNNRAVCTSGQCTVVN